MDQSYQWELPRLPRVGIQIKITFWRQYSPGTHAECQCVQQTPKTEPYWTGICVFFGISKKSFAKQVVWHFNSNLVPFVLISCNGRSSKCILCYCLSGPSAIKRVQDCKKWGTLSWENIKNIQGNLKPHTSKLNNTGLGVQKRGTFNCEKISKTRQSNHCGFSIYILIIQSQSQWSGWSEQKRWSCLVWSLLER